MNDWLRILDAIAERHFCELDHKDCEDIAREIRGVIAEKDREIAELKAEVQRLLKIIWASTNERDRK